MLRQENFFSDFCNGRTYDFKFFKESGAALQPHVLILADAGYQGISKIHKNSRTPFKKKKNRPLSEEEKAANRYLAKKRMKAEHIFRKLKIFRILREKYRNRRKRFSLRFNLITRSSPLPSWEIAPSASGDQNVTQ